MGVPRALVVVKLAVERRRGSDRVRWWCDRAPLWRGVRAAPALGREDWGQHGRQRRPGGRDSCQERESEGERSG